MKIDIRVVIFEDLGLETFKEWLRKSVDLAVLSEGVQEFLRGSGFNVVSNRKDTGYLVSGIPRRGCALQERVAVEIQGDCEDLKVRLIVSEQERRSMWLGLLTTVIGGGGVLLKGLKAREALEGFERDFWRYVEEKVIELTDQE